MENMIKCSSRFFKAKKFLNNNDNAENHIDKKIQEAAKVYREKKNTNENHTPILKAKSEEFKHDLIRKIRTLNKEYKKKKIKERSSAKTEKEINIIENKISNPLDKENKINNEQDNSFEANIKVVENIDEKIIIGGDKSDI